jgi:1,4-alpha-glucan branching enzyme
MHDLPESTTATSAPLVARPGADGMSMFRVWAPAAERVEAEVNGGRTQLAAGEGGFFEGKAQARAGDDYVFVLDERERWPDQCSRWA